MLFFMEALVTRTRTRIYKIIHFIIFYIRLYDVTLYLLNNIKGLTVTKQVTKRLQLQNFGIKARQAKSVPKKY